MLRYTKVRYQWNNDYRSVAPDSVGLPSSAYLPYRFMQNKRGEMSRRATAAILLIVGAGVGR